MGKKTKYYELKSSIRRKVCRVLHLSLWLKNSKGYEVETFSVKKLRNFPVETYINGNGRDIK